MNGHIKLWMFCPRTRFGALTHGSALPTYPTLTRNSTTTTHPAPYLSPLAVPLLLRCSSPAGPLRGLCSLHRHRGARITDARTGRKQTHATQSPPWQLWPTEGGGGQDLGGLLSWSWLCLWCVRAAGSLCWGGVCVGGEGSLITSVVKCSSQSSCLCPLLL